MTKLRTDVLEISYYDAGPADGPPVLILHGWPDSARPWTVLADHLAGLGFRCLVPELRGHGETRFLAPETPRDGQAVALAQDALDFLDASGVGRVAVVGHDWGARVAYTLAALDPSRLTRMVTLALAYQPGGVFSMPDFPQARAFWYQWLMYVDAGVEAIRRDPAGFARLQWDTWSPPGWFDDAEFAATATAFANPDWVEITLNAYRSRFLASEPRDPGYDPLRDRLAGISTLDVDTLMIQGGSDHCDEPGSSAGQEPHFTAGYRREVLPGVGHFPHREAPDAVISLVRAHLTKE